MKIWDTRSAYDPEAEGLVRSLYGKLHFAGDVTEKLRTDPSLDESIRKHALVLVQQEGDHDPVNHLRAAWDIARAPGAGRSMYGSALRRARMACELAPWDWEAFNA